jgi:hypothetical protein
MRLGGMHRCNFFPFFGFEHVLETSGVPFVFLVDASDHVNALVVVNEAVGWVSEDREIAQLEYFRGAASEYEMRINDLVVFGASNDMNIAIGDDDGFGVIR